MWLAVECTNLAGSLSYGHGSQIAEVASRVMLLIFPASGYDLYAYY